MVRVVKRGTLWRVQEKRGWLWRYIGPFGVAAWGRWAKFSDAVWFADLCDRVDARNRKRCSDSD